MELRHLRYFHAIARSGSISNAGEILHVTQPTLSRQLAELEREIGHQLLNRTAAGVTLTAAGQGLMEHLETVFLQLDRISEVVKTHAEGDSVLNLGLPTGVPHDWFKDFEADLQKRAPRVRLSLHEASSDDQRIMLQRGTIQIGLLHARPTELHAELVLEQDIGVVVRPDSTLASRSEVSLTDLQNLRIMAHVSGEVSEEEVRLRRAATVNGVTIEWLFRKFAEHSELIADNLSADAVLITQSSAALTLPRWRWIPLVHHEESADTAVRTWASWANPDIPHLHAAIAAMRAASLRSTSAADKPATTDP